VVGLLFPTVVGVALAFMLGGGDEEPAGTSQQPAAQVALKADRFDAGRAFAELRRQVEMGPRPAGSEPSRALADRIRRTIPNGRFEAVPGGLRNVFGRVKGKGRPVLLAAHYDTKDIPGFVGANDGAGGTAAVMELARYFGRNKPYRDLRFAFFDGEECPDDSADFYSCGLRGSRHHAAKGIKYRHVILLDFVADRDLAIPYEQGSDRKLWARLRAAARRVGAADAFPEGEQGEVLDDHTPFRRRGISAIDLIDFDFPCWHETCDDMSAVSQKSLDKSGETVLELVRTLTRK
jgi:glutaminyl-peptide cyclotransferase